MVVRREVSIPGHRQVGRMKSDPIAVPRTSRSMDMRVLTSFMPGKMVPIAAFPLLREDRLKTSRFRLNFEQMETAELLVNAVNVRVMAYLVPHLAFTRFDGIDALNRSYSRVLAAGSTTHVPYFTTLTAGAHGTNAIHKAMGKHERPGQVVNGGYVECYNTIWNFRAANRSPDIPERSLVDTTLAPAFWQHEQFAHVVPDFDQAVIDGEVPLNIVSGDLPVRGIGAVTTANAVAGNAQMIDMKGVMTGKPVTGVWTTPSNNLVYIQTKNTGVVSTTNIPQIFAEMQENGVTVSLSNIELARKTQAFAALRKQYTGHDDDYIIDLLMSGITVPEQAWRQPILLADRGTIFGMSKRYASDSTDLTASVVNGATFVDLTLTTPTVPTGGVVMICVEVTPEQLFERQEDPFLNTTDQDLLPEFLRDTLDPEKVEIVQNQYVDINHTTPTGTFGYAPLNHRWSHIGPGIGGKFFRPLVDAPTDEDRQRLWACEVANPTLSRDFYLTTSIHTKPFVVTTGDPYEAVMRGLVQIEGNTVFGNLLIEASDDYEQILEEAPMDRIVKPASLETEEASS